MRKIMLCTALTLLLAGCMPAQAGEDIPAGGEGDYTVKTEQVENQVFTAKKDKAKKKADKQKKKEEEDKEGKKKDKEKKDKKNKEEKKEKSESKTDKREERSEERTGELKTVWSECRKVALEPER